MSHTLATHLLAAGMAICALSGCGKTLMFGERSGLNLAIRVDPAGQPPVMLNLGLNRTVGTIVPPATQSRDNRPSGDAISMFSGFQVESFSDPVQITPATVARATGNPFSVDLLIGTQFASGAAAMAVAEGDPEVVRQIVSVGPLLPLSPIPLTSIAAVRATGSLIARLGAEGRRCLASDLKISLPDRGAPDADRTVDTAIRQRLANSASDASALSNFDAMVKAAGISNASGRRC